MKLEIVSGGEETCVELPDGTITLGGSEADGVQIAGLAEAILELHLEADRLMVTSRATFTINGVLSPPGVPRLVLPGEVVELDGGVQLKQPVPGSVEPAGTSALLRSLLGDAPGPDEARCATLTCLTGLDVGRTFPIAGALAEIGRGEQVHIRVRDRGVSRRHARIKRSQEGYLLEDLSSPNGVYLNGQRIKGAVPLEDGAVLELGHSLLRFKAPWSEPEPGAEEPLAADAPPEPAPVPPKPRNRAEVALICVGATLALVGMLVTFGLVSG